MMQTMTVRVGPCGDESQREFNVHPSLLALASPVFKSMLSHDMQESRSVLIELPEKSPAQFEMLLTFITPIDSRKAKVTPDNVEALLWWAEEYCMDWLKLECEETLLTMPSSPSMLLRAHKFSLLILRAQCLQNLIERPNVECDWSECLDEHALLKDIFQATWVNVLANSDTACLTYFHQIHVDAQTGAHILSSEEALKLKHIGRCLVEVVSPEQVNAGMKLLWKASSADSYHLTRVREGPDAEGDIKVLEPGWNKVSAWIGCSKNSRRRTDESLLYILSQCE